MMEEEIKKLIHLENIKDFLGRAGDHYFRLDENKNAISCSVEECSDQIEKMFETDTKHVNREIVGDYWISTVWLGLNHQYSIDQNAPPLIFETMIMHNDGKWLDYQERYSTWQEAEEGHTRAVEWVKNGCKEDE